MAGRAKKKVSRKKKTERFLFLETQLDAQLESRRSQLPFMRELFKNFGGMELIAKEVHSRSDLKKFLDHARSSREITAVHLVAHGKHSGADAALVLTRDEWIDLRRPANQGLFADLNLELLFLSTCQLGADAAFLEKLREKSKVDAVFSYTRDVDDYQAILIESLFYHLAYGYVRGRLSHVSLKEVYERLKFSVDYLGIDDGLSPLAYPLLAASFK